MTVCVTVIMPRTIFEQSQVKQKPNEYLRKIALMRMIFYDPERKGDHEFNDRKIQDVGKNITSQVCKIYSVAPHPHCIPRCEVMWITELI